MSPRLFAALLTLAPCVAGLVLPTPMTMKPAHVSRTLQPKLLFSPPTRTPPEVTDEDGSFGKALRRLQASPTRAAMLATYLSALFYVGSGSAPQGSPDETLAIVMNCLDTAAEPSIFFVIFNALGVLPALYAAVLLPGAKDQRPAPPALIATSFFAGFGGLGPYLFLRQPRPQPISRAELGFIARTVTESKLFGVAMVLTSLGLGAKLATIPDFDAALATYWSLFDQFGIVNVSSFDLLVLSLFFFEPLREDMQRRGWYAAPGEDPSTEEIARLAAFCAVPVLGPAAYVLARPALPLTESE